MGLSLATTSGKGGTGKSTVSVGLALAFVALGRRVLLVDLDEGLRCLDLILGVDREVTLDLSDILSGCDIADATYAPNGFENLSVIPAPMNLGEINSKKFAEFARKVTNKYDVVIFDFPAGIDFSLYGLLDKRTTFMTVCNPDPVSVKAAGAVCRNLADKKITARLIINRFQPALMRNGTYSNVDDVIDLSGIRLLGIIPQSTELALLSVNHDINKRCKAARAFKRIAERLCGKDVKLPRLTKI